MIQFSDSESSVSPPFSLNLRSRFQNLGGLDSVLIKINRLCNLFTRLVFVHLNNTILNSSPTTCASYHRVAHQSATPRSIWSPLRRPVQHSLYTLRSFKSFNTIGRNAPLTTSKPDTFTTSTTRNKNGRFQIKRVDRKVTDCNREEGARASVLFQSGWFQNVTWHCKWL